MGCPFLILDATIQRILLKLNDQKSSLQAAVLTTLDAGNLNYMLNLEYLMAEFYSCAATGFGLPAPLRLGGPPSIGCQRASLTGTVSVSRHQQIRSRLWAHTAYFFPFLSCRGQGQGQLRGQARTTAAECNLIAG